MTNVNVLNPESLTPEFRNSPLVKMLERFEGKHSTEYRDGEGNRHWGIGHNKEIQQTEREIAIQGNGTALSDDQIYDLLYEDINDALEDLHFIYTDEQINSWDETRRNVIISQMFQCGIGTIKKFGKMIAAIKEEDWETAAAESLDSKVAREQAPERWQEQARMLRNGTPKPKHTGSTQNTETPLEIVEHIQKALNQLQNALKGGA